LSHNHNHSTEENKTSSILWALILNAGFSVVEIIGGIFSNSFAILSEAVHDLGDTIALATALIFEKYSFKSADTTFTFGYRRFSVLSAMINSLILLGGSFGIIIVSFQRLFHPEIVDSVLMIWISIFGIAINFLAMLKLRPHSHSHNHSVLALHLLEDVLGWVAIFIGSIIIYFTDWYILDPILSISVSLYIGFNASKSVRSVLMIFLQAVPKNIDLEKITKSLEDVPQIISIHSLRIWTLDDEKHIISFHAVLKSSISSEELIIVKHELKKTTAVFNVTQTTVEFEFESEICKG